MEYDPTGNEFTDVINDSPEAEKWVMEIVEQGADYWAANVRWRTGFNATHIAAYTEHVNGHLQGVVLAYGYYARFREHGTRNNAAEHVMRDWLQIVERS